MHYVSARTPAYSLCIWLIFFLSISIGLGSQNSIAAPGKTEEARAWVKRGQEALKEKRLSEALIAFESADRYAASVNHKMLIAKVYEAMPKSEGCLRAITTWRSVLTELKTQSSPLVKRAEEKINHLEEECTRQISVVSEPRGAKVWIKDELIGFTPLVASVQAGEADVRAVYQSETLTQILDAKKEEVSFKFNSSPQAEGNTNKGTQTVSNMNKTGQNTPIKFEAVLKCRALVNGEYQDLNHCQSRALWEGDQFKLEFHSDQDVYLYVFLSNDSGQRQTLFPRGSTPNRLSAFNRSSLPMRNWFTLDDVGPIKEKIFVIYSSQPVSAFEAMRNLNQGPKKSANGDIKLKTLAMASVRGVVLPDDNQQLKLSVSDQLDDQQHFIGRDEVNRVEFELLHQGARPKKAN